MRDAGAGRNRTSRAIVAANSRADPARRPEICAIDAIQHKAWSNPRRIGKAVTRLLQYDGLLVTADTIGSKRRFRPKSHAMPPSTWAVASSGGGRGDAPLPYAAEPLTGRRCHRRDDRLSRDRPDENRAVRQGTVRGGLFPRPPTRRTDSPSCVVRAAGAAAGRGSERLGRPVAGSHSSKVRTSQSVRPLAEVQGGTRGR